MNTTSIKNRFLATITTNVLRAGVSFITGIAIARYLGPENYGHYNFLIGSFTAMVSLVDMGTSTAFYTFISQNSRGKRFYLYYGFWIVLRFCLLLIFVLLVPDNLREKIWLGQSKEFILLALLAIFSMNQIWQFAGQAGESIRDTVGVQLRNLVLAASFLICVLVLIKTNLLSLRSLFVTNTVLYFLLAFLYGVRLYRSPVLMSEKNETFRDILSQFRIYCVPLILFSLAGFFYTFADYWLLQLFGGAVQQGYYAVGFQFASISLLATTSIIQVFWKEIAEAHAQGNAVRVRNLYQIISRSLLFFGAVISCLLIPFSQEILTLFLGQAYQSAWLPLSLMFLYPIHQSMGQITSIMLMATGKTKTRSAIGVFFIVTSIFTSYVMLAPKDSLIPGFNMGATGLAIKMLICQFVEVNLMAFFVSRFINAAYDWGHQLVLLILLPLGYLCKLVAGSIMSFLLPSYHIISFMAVSGLVYIISVAFLVRFFPSIAGLDKGRISFGITWLRGRLDPS